MVKPDRALDVESVRAALAAVPAPDGERDVIAAGLVTSVTVKGDRVGLVVEAPASLPAPEARRFEAVRAACEAAVRALPSVAAVTAVLTAHTEAAQSRTAHAGARAGGRPGGQGGGHGRLALPGVAAVVAVASGKGGVGKSTIAANLACALAREGAVVGLLDADVFGPSAPILFGLEGARPDLDADKRIVPPTAYGVKVMSMGFMAAAETAMIWRGPMVMSAITQLLDAVAWAPLDVLVVDMPPGTGDAQLTLAQRAPLAGALIVSTPQKLALADVRRGVELFAKTHVPLFGVIENMSARVDPATGARFAPFGEGGAREAADALGAPFLGALPLDEALAAASDAGRPPAAVDPEGEAGRWFAQLARTTRAAIAAGSGRPPPDIRFD